MRSALTVSLLLLAVAARADLYTWVDAKGVTHYSSAPPEKSSVQKKLTVLKAGKTSSPSYKASPAYATAAPITAASPVEAAQPAKNSPAPRVELYTTSWCPHCKEARQYLDSRGIAYQAYDIESDRQAYDRYRGFGGQGVPLAVIGGRSVRGFSPQAYGELLSANP